MKGSARRAGYDISTDPSRGRIRRVVSSSLGLVIVLFNLLAGIALASDAAAASAPFEDEIFGDRIVICTGAGRIVLGLDGKPVPDVETSASLCAACLPLVGGSVGLPAVVQIEVPHALAFTLLVAETVTEPRLVHRLEAASPRGPPLV